MSSAVGNKSARLGIFGGTFDPPHVGHLILADEAREQLDLDSIQWVLTPFPPHKSAQQITPVEVRLELLRAAISQNPKFILNRADLDRPPPHFAADTVRLVREQFPHAQLVYLMGGDSLDDLPNWHGPREFVASTDLIGVMRRPGEFVDLQRLETELPGISAKIEFLNAPFVEISSSLIRKRAYEWGAFRYYLPKNVYRLIVKQKLYREGEPG